MDCGGGGRRQTLATEDGGFLQSAELRIQTTAAEEEISCIPPGHQVLGHLVKGELAEQSDVSFAARDAWQGLLTSASRNQRLPPLNHSLTKPPPFLSVALAEVVSKQPPFSRLAVESRLLPLSSLPAPLALHCQPLKAAQSCLQQLKNPKFSLAIRSEPCDSGCQYLLIMCRTVGIY